MMHTTIDPWDMADRGFGLLTKKSGIAYGELTIGLKSAVPCKLTYP